MDEARKARAEEILDELEGIDERAEGLARLVCDDPSQRPAIAGEVERLDARLGALTAELGELAPKTLAGARRMLSEVTLDLRFARRKERAVSLRLGRHIEDSFERTGEKLAKALAALGPPAVPALIEVVRPKATDADWDAAADSVAAIDAAWQLDRLVDGLRNHEVGVRGWAAQALGKIGDPRAVPALLEVLGDPDHRTAAAAGPALKGLGAAAVEPLADALRDPRVEARRTAARVLGWIGDARAVPALVAAAGDEDEYVRAFVVEALATIGGDEAREVALAAAGDPHHWVRRQAADALGRFGGEPAFRRLSEALADPDPMVRGAAAAALTAWGAAAIPPLLAAFDGPPLPAIRTAVIEALAKVPDPRAVEPLSRVLREEKDESDRKQAVSALSAIGGPAVVEPLIGALADGEYGVRCWAAQTLGEIRDARAVPPLVRLLADPEAGVRADAATALGLIGDTTAVDPLVAALGDEDFNVRYFTAEALGRLRDARAVEPLRRALEGPDGGYHEVVRQALAGISGDAAPAGPSAP